MIYLILFNYEYKSNQQLQSIFKYQLAAGFNKDYDCLIVVVVVKLQHLPTCQGMVGITINHKVSEGRV